jgi:release factor glutamine methyltransferase
VNGKPVAYITGIREFWSLSLRVNDHVLIPRAETELLVETVLKLLPPDQPQSLVDLGTGCGAIALALARERPQWQVYATDISNEALKLAQLNCNLLNITNVKFFHGDWFAAIPPQKFNAIVSNPPYIDNEDPTVDPLVKKYEPTLALISPQQGLAAIGHIATHAHNYLQKGGILLFEHGSMQRAAVETIFKKNGFSNVECVQDYAGHPRVSFAVFG